jgi:hypothetical protein
VWKAAYRFVQAHPERVPAPVWFQAIGSDAEKGDRAYGSWFASVGDGPLDMSRSFFLGYNINLNTPAQLATLRARRPLAVGVLARTLETLHGNKPTLAQFDAVYAPILEIDLDAMLRRSRLLRDDIPAYRKQLEAMAALSPEYWNHLAFRLREEGLEDEAAGYFRRYFDEGRSVVGVCSEIEWLVAYDLDHDNVEAAGKIARRCGEVYSGAGLALLGYYLERRGDLAGALEQYEKIDKRYHQKRSLREFYMRRRAAGDRTYEKEAAEAEKELFPEGLLRASRSDFSGPPQDGAEILDEVPFMRAIGLKKGDVVGGLDGYRVRSYAEYAAVRNLQHGPDLHLIVWDGAAWREVKTRCVQRRFWNTFGKYTAKGAPPVPAPK